MKSNAGIKATTLEVDYNKSLKRTATDIGKTNVSLMLGQYNSLNNDNHISISQNIPFPTVFSSQAKLGNAQIKGSELKLALTKNELVSQVKSTYHHLQFLQSERKLLLSQDSIYSAFVNASQLRFKTGESNLLEKTTAETQSMEIKNLF